MTAPRAAKCVVLVAMFVAFLGWVIAGSPPHPASGETLRAASKNPDVP